MRKGRIDHIGMESAYSRKPMPLPATSNPEVAKWRERICQGLKFREPWEQIWRQNREYENLAQWNPNDRGDKVRVNKLGAWINSRLAALTLRRPKARLKPASGKGYEQMPIPTGGMDPMGQPKQALYTRTEVTESVLNKIASSPNLADAAKFRRFARYGLTSYGIIKVGYEPTFKNDDMLRDEQATDEITGEPLWDDEGNPIYLYDEPIEDSWFIDVIPPERIIIDPNGENDFRDHDWVVEMYVRSVKDIQSDPNLKNTDGIRGTMTERWREEEPGGIDEPGQTGDHTAAGDPDKRMNCMVYEIHDLKNGRLYMIVDGHGEFVMDQERPPGIDHSPYVFFRPQEIDGEFYQRPPATDLVPLNREYDMHRTMMMRAMRKHSRKIFIRSLYATPAVLGSLRSENDNEIIPIDGNVDMRAIAAPVPYNDISGTLFAYAPMVNQDFDLVGGVGAERSGVLPNRTASAANIAEMGNSMREDYLRNIFAQSLREVYKKLLDSVQANLTLDASVELVGPSGELFFAQVRDRDIIGDYDVEVDVEEMVPNNSDLKRSQFVQAIGLIGQSMPLFAGNEPLISKVMDMFGIRDPELVSAIAQTAAQAVAAQNAPPPGQQGNVQPEGNPADMIASLMGGALGG